VLRDATYVQRLSNATSKHIIAKARPFVQLVAIAMANFELEITNDGSCEAMPRDGRRLALLRDSK
jgi:hypothetical protein